MVEDLEDARRQEPPYILDDRPMLEGWLEFHRVTLLMKCEGLDDAGRKARPVPTSLLSLHGLLRHMAEVERNWFRRVLLREPETPSIWYDPAVEDSELVPLDDADWEADVAAWQAECEASRRAAAAAPSKTPVSGGANQSPCAGSMSTWSRSTPATTATPTSSVSWSTDRWVGSTTRRGPPHSSARSTPPRAAGHPGRVPRTVGVDFFLPEPPNDILVTLPIAGAISSTRSTFGNGLVKQQDLLLVGRLKIVAHVSKWARVIGQAVHSPDRLRRSARLINSSKGASRKCSSTPTPKARARTRFSSRSTRAQWPHSKITLCPWARRSWERIHS